MSTRKLILTALMCGLAIMLAGGVKLFQTANNDKKVEILAVGQEAVLGDMTVSVKAIIQGDQETIVTVQMMGVDGADAREGWRLLTGSTVLQPAKQTSQSGVSCGTVSVDIPVQCDVVFAPTTGRITVAYLRSGLQRQWSK